jgi:two-component sensor histidine kinase
MATELSSVLNLEATNGWPFAAGRRARARPLAADGEATFELGFRSAALRVGLLLGWVSIATVLAGLALDVGARHRWLLVGLTLAAAAANTVATLVPWQEWLPTRRGRVLLDLWSGGLIAYVALLVYAGGANFTLLLFLAIPFIAVVQTGWRRGFWLAASAGTCALAAALIPLSAGATAMRLALVAAAVGVALVLARTIRREAAAHKRAAARAELERTLAREANHRIKNNLQTVTDLLLLGRPENGDGRAFDEAAARIRSIATVHRLLTEAEDAVDAGALLRSIAEGAPVPVVVEVEPVSFDAATAQKLGIVANELITNAFQHGASPIVVQLRGGRRTRLRVDDGGIASRPRAASVSSSSGGWSSRACADGSS